MYQEEAVADNVMRSVDSSPVALCVKEVTDKCMMLELVNTQTGIRVVKLLDRSSCLALSSWLSQGAGE